MYEATASVQFNDQSSDLNALGTPVFPSANPAQGAAADAEVITSNEVVRGVQRSVHTDLSQTEIRDSVEASVDPNTNLVTIKVSADDAKLAANLANAFANETKDVVTRAQEDRLQEAIDRLQQTVHDQPRARLPRRSTSTGSRSCARLPLFRAAGDDLRAGARAGRSLIAETRTRHDPGRGFSPASSSA